MISHLLFLAIGIAVGVIFHAAIGPWAMRAWQQLRSKAEHTEKH